LVSDLESDGAALSDAVDAGLSCFATFRSPPILTGRPD
jgi:hypothetical protein